MFPGISFPMFATGRIQPRIRRLPGRNHPLECIEPLAESESPGYTRERLRNITGARRTNAGHRLLRSGKRTFFSDRITTVDHNALACRVRRTRRSQPRNCACNLIGRGTAPGRRDKSLDSLAWCL